MWFVYILHCNDDSFYTGYTNDPQRRYFEHSHGKGGHYTSGHKPIEIVHLEEFPTKIDAMKRERQIKGWSRQKKISI